MKKRYLMVIGIFVAVMAISGCGKKEESQKQSQTEVQETVVPSENTTSTEKPIELVEMEEISEDEQIKNVIGTKTATSSRLIINNSTGADIAAIYIRPYHEDNDDTQWGEELIKESFTLNKGDQAMYYYDPTEKDENGQPISLYDIRIRYTDSNRSECYFRKLPLKTITTITLRMDVSGDYGIPYATYLAGTSKEEVSTLNEVKQRLGLIGYDSTDSSQNNENSSQITEPTQAPSDDTGDDQSSNTSDGDEDIDYGGVDSGAEQAQEYIGHSLSELIGACGSPSSQSYEDEPETGRTGYHYYDTFTVSTIVDENGNETVAGVW